MRILLIHQGFPGQFSHLIPALVARGDELWAISRPQQQIPAGVWYPVYRQERGNGRDTLPLASELERLLSHAHLPVPLDQQGCLRGTRLIQRPVEGLKCLFY